ncbi:polyamine ABC transporter substrate-binding protein [Streptomyces jeddahensis]|uniref:polyamine ABC transporter substrate-binding protein n=1 Tax=Streptomyces jeddahensis TaxID=1716141 RepID=UPI001E2F56A6|nr:spermidine/putrescine ABC transporter substrate-binding protein [Streptomyces jeddahensis]
MAAGLALFLVTGCGEEGSRSNGPDALDPKADITKQSLTVSIWDGYSPEDLPARVKDDLGVPVKIAHHATNEEIMAKLTAGGAGGDSDSGIDVAFVSGQYAQALNEAGLLEPIHADLIPNLKNLYPEAQKLAYDKGNTFSVPYTWGTTGICYRTDLVKQPPTSWNDLLNPPPALKKKVTMMTTERWLALPALKALGHSVNTTSDQELDAARTLLLKAKKNLLAYDDTTFGDRLTKGESAMAEAWDGWCPTSDPKIEFTVPKEGSDLWVDTMVVLKSSKNKEAAHALINYILDPEIHSWAAENILYKVPNKAAMEQLDPKVLEANAPLRMTPAELLKGESIVDVGEAATKYTRLSTEVAAGS